MASTISKLRGDVEENLQDQVSRLTKELAYLKTSLSKRGSRAYEETRDTASDVYADLWDKFTETMPVVRKRARAAEKVARENPATAAFVGLAVVGLLVTLMARR